MASIGWWWLPTRWNGWVEFSTKANSMDGMEPFLVCKNGVATYRSWVTRSSSIKKRARGAKKDGWPGSYSQPRTFMCLFLPSSLLSLSQHITTFTISHPFRRHSRTTRWSCAFRQLQYSSLRLQLDNIRQGLHNVFVARSWYFENRIISGSPAFIVSDFESGGFRRTLTTKKDQRDAQEPSSSEQLQSFWGAHSGVFFDRSTRTTVPSRPRGSLP